ncbi:aspartyl protease [Aureobasidium sp. EXF-10728]|nr:aspartyl protease [Aureobasidium sp. EXF-10728]
MHFNSHFALVASLVSSALASPVDVSSKRTVSIADIKGKKTFTVQQVLAKKQEMLAPALSMLSTYAKFSATPPTQLKAAGAAIQAGTVQATPQNYDMSYLCPVSVGGQTLNLNFDSGSADLWVYSTLQPSSQQSGHSIYDPSMSSTSQLLVGNTWSIKYGDGSTASGKVYADKVIVGSVTATSQAVEAATSVSQSFLNDKNNDGLVGLSFSNINTVSPNQQKTFFDTVKGSLALPLWTANLKKGAPGTYDFGYIDSSKYSGKITYVNVNSASGFWQFTADGYQVGSSSTVSSSFVAIADTGTSLMYLPSSFVTAYWGQVTGAGYDSNQGGYTFPCSSALPDFNVVVGGNKFTVPGSYMNYAQISYTTCFGGMQQNTGLSFSILGDIFLKSQFMVFSEVGGQATLGFAAMYNGTAGEADGDEWDCED